jgi:hypothetical protein
VLHAHTMSMRTGRRRPPHTHAHAPEADADFALEGSEARSAMAVAGTSRSSGGGIAVVDLTAREKKRAYNASVIFGARGSQSSSEAF